MSSVQKVMSRIVGVFASNMEMSRDRNQMQAIRKGILNDIKTLNLKRDQIACHNMLEAMTVYRDSYQITLAYVFDGVNYPVHKNVPGCPVNGTDYLHTLGMTSAQWDALEKVHIWVHSGVVCATNQ